jgi:phage terminase large subunit-like protein
LDLKPTKDKSTERIDGIVATIMAIGRAMVAQETPDLAAPMAVWC